MIAKAVGFSDGTDEIDAAIMFLRAHGRILNTNVQNKPRSLRTEITKSRAVSLAQSSIAPISPSGSILRTPNGNPTIRAIAMPSSHFIGRIPQRQISSHFHVTTIPGAAREMGDGPITHLAIVVTPKSRIKVRINSIALSRASRTIARRSAFFGSTGDCSTLLLLWT